MGLNFDKYLNNKRTYFRVHFGPEINDIRKIYQEKDYFNIQQRPKESRLMEELSDIINYRR